jgi:hypothetical protein
MKMNRPHRGPLARKAILILRELHRMTGQGEFVLSRMPMARNRRATTVP